MFKLPQLSFVRNSLSPYISEKTIHYHYDKHHKQYVDNLNNLTMNTKFYKSSLEDIIKYSTDSIFNNAAQVWNHNFYWQCLSPKCDISSYNVLVSEIEKNFYSLKKFKVKFIQEALLLFGSGWTWLIKNEYNELEIRNTSNAECLINNANCTPLLVCDVWEHAYYLDYMNQRHSYLEGFWNVINWNFVNSQLINT